MGLNLLFSAALVVILPCASIAGPVNDACLGSNHEANPLLCECMQRVADLTLTDSDQHLAASIFANPGRAGELRASQGESDHEFWLRYVNFGESTEAVCSRN